MYRSMPGSAPHCRRDFPPSPEDGQFLRSSGYQMNGRHTHDANRTPSVGSRRGYSIREKSQLDATFVGTVVGADPAESLIEALKEDQRAEEAAEADHFKRELDLIDTRISRIEAEVERAESVVRRDAEKKDLLQRQKKEIEETLKATELKIVEKSGQLLKARSGHPLLAIKRRREQHEALEELRKQTQPERDGQEADERRLAREHAERLSRSLRGSIFTRPVAILLMWIGLVGLLVLGWWTGERIRSVVDTARLAGALDTLADVTTSLLDGGIVWRALVALAVLLLLAVAVTGVRKDLVRRTLPARRSRWPNRPLPNDPAGAGWARHVSIVLGVMALLLLAVATMGLLFGGTDAGPMLSTFVGAGAFTFAGMALWRVIAGATAFWGGSRDGCPRRGEFSISISTPPIPLGALRLLGRRRPLRGHPDGADGRLRPFHVRPRFPAHLDDSARIHMPPVGSHLLGSAPRAPTRAS